MQKSVILLHLQKQQNTTALVNIRRNDILNKIKAIHIPVNNLVDRTAWKYTRHADFSAKLQPRPTIIRSLCTQTEAIKQFMETKSFATIKNLLENNQAEAFKKEKNQKFGMSTNIIVRFVNKRKKRLITFSKTVTQPKLFHQIWKPNVCLLINSELSFMDQIEKIWRQKVW